MTAPAVRGRLVCCLAADGRAAPFHGHDREDWPSIYADPSFGAADSDRKRA
jgi:hypothetical protein